MNRKELIHRIVSRTIEHEDSSWEMDINKWDWTPGVGLYGIFKAWQCTQKEEYLEYIDNWIQKHLHKAYEIRTVNSTVPLLTVLEVYKVTKNIKYLKACIDIAEWIVDEAPRTREGGLEHTVTEGATFSEQIWADTLFMVGIFLTKLGANLNSEKYLEEAAKQLRIHHKLLKNKETGLFYHGWNCEEQNWMSSGQWGRANAWITVSTVEMLEELPDQFEGREEVLNSLQAQVKALHKYQRPSGGFGTLLDHEDAYEETSAAAGFAYGIKRGIKKGFISLEYEEIWKKSEKSVISKINEKGEVEQVSTGTPIVPIQTYKKIPVSSTLYGQALTLLMLSEED